MPPISDVAGKTTAVSVVFFGYKPSLVRPELRVLDDEGPRATLSQPPFDKLPRRAAVLPIRVTQGQ